MHSSQVRAKVAENFNNNDFSSKPWRKWMKTSVQDAIDRLEEMTDPEPMASPPASAAASPKKKNDGAALKPAPGVDTCSDQFIDDAEDIVQEALDEHRDSKKKGVVRFASHALVTNNSFESCLSCAAEVRNKADQYVDVAG